MSISLRHAGLSDVGQQREVNEDSFCTLPRFGLFIVADGMGGHKAGDVASQMATESMTQFFSDTEGEDSTWPFHFDPQRTYEENRLLASVKLANRRIYEASIGDSNVQGMGTTVVSCVFTADREMVYIGHVGDSRCYRLRDKEFRQLTEDHSLINDYRQAMPHLTDEQMAALPRNVITRALGMQESVIVDIQVDLPEPGDVYLLCSDGLSETLTEQEMADILAEQSDNLESATKKLVESANKSGGDDNITVVLVAIDGTLERKDHEDEEDEKPDPDITSTQRLVRDQIIIESTLPERDLGLDDTQKFATIDEDEDNVDPDERETKPDHERPTVPAGDEEETEPATEPELVKPLTADSEDESEVSEPEEDEPEEDEPEEDESEGRVDPDQETEEDAEDDGESGDEKAEVDEADEESPKGEH